MENKKKTEFGELLVRLIKNKKMTQSYFYTKVGITKPYFYHILSEEIPPSAEVQFRMIEVLKPKKEDRERFFDLVAKAKNDIPADIHNYLKGEPEKYKLIRKMMEEQG